MIKNYIKITFRNLLRHKVYSFINIFGLAVGLACFILIIFFAEHELSYDSFYDNSDDIYRVVKRHPGSDMHGLDTWAVTSAQLPAALVDEFPEVTAATSINDQKALLSYDGQHFWEEGLWADADYFDVFSIPLLQGNPETVLDEPNTIILTESLARKIFEDQDPVGETLLYERNSVYTVTGVMPDMPENSSIRYEFITSIRSQPYYRQTLDENLWNDSFHTFFVMDGGDVSQSQLQVRMPAFVEKYVPNVGNDPETRVQYMIQSLGDLHLKSEFVFDIASTGDIRYVYLFFAIGFLILLLACVNYTNLTIARSIRRAREVGMRKVLGATRRQLANQFLGESVLMAFLALLFALLFVELLAPFFSQLMDRPIQMDLLGSVTLLPLLILVVLVGLLSGSYPALYISSLSSMQILTNKADNLGSQFRSRRLLVIGQYAIAIVLIIGNFVVHKQMQFVQTTDIGYDREHVVTISIQDEALRENYEVIREEWMRYPQVLAVTSSAALPTNISSNNGITGLDESSAVNRLGVYITYADYDFLEVFGMELVAGRTFSNQISSDSRVAALVNETAVRRLGWTPWEAIGKTFIHNDGARTIIGVVKDFHIHSMHMPIEPLVIRFRSNNMNYFSAKLQADDLPETIALLEQTVEQFSSYPFEYQFLDERFNNIYKAERKLGETFDFFSFLALLIASLGLFGLAAYDAEQRTKEIGVRKVLGASVANIVTLLGRDFLKLVIIGFLIAVPVAWYMMNRWLEDFVYRIEIGPDVFFVAGLTAVLIALITVSWQSVKAALANPVDSLRSE